MNNFELLLEEIASNVQTDYEEPLHGERRSQR